VRKEGNKKSDRLEEELIRNQIDPIATDEFVLEAILLGFSCTIVIFYWKVNRKVTDLRKLKQKVDCL